MKVLQGKVVGGHGTHLPGRLSSDFPSPFSGFLFHIPSPPLPPPPHHINMNNAVTILCGYGSYLLADLAEASGVLSMVAAGLYLSFHGLGRISARVTASLSSFWAMASFIAETIIFFVSGLVGEGRG